MLRRTQHEERASVGGTIPEGTAFGVGMAVVALGALGAVALYKHDQVPAAVVTGIATIGLAPQITRALV